MRELGFLEMAAANCKLEALAKAWAICDPPYTVLVDVADAVDVAVDVAVGVAVGVAADAVDVVGAVA